MHLTVFLKKAIGLLAALTIAAALPAAAQQAPATAKMAEESYKNIQVLKGIPADQVIPSMRVFAGALGQRCQFCHVDGDFVSDMKMEKATARKMITMMNDINKANFNGRQQVTCYTCHDGSNNPANTPLLPTTENPEQPRPTMPSADDILSKYISAIGGEQAVRKVTSRVITGTQDIPSGVQGDRTMVPAQFERDQKAPNLVVTSVHNDKVATADGFDGTTAWAKDARGMVADIAEPYQARMKRNSDMFESLNLKQEYMRIMVRGIQKVDGKDAYVVIGNPVGDGAERLFFDTQTGLLVRKVTVLPTAGGNLPQEVDYDDYRDTGSGVKIPFTIRMIPATPGNSLATVSTIKVQKVQDNVPIDNAKLAKPPAKATAAAAQ